MNLAKLCTEIQYNAEQSITKIFEECLTKQNKNKQKKNKTSEKVKTGFGPREHPSISPMHFTHPNIQTFFTQHHYSQDTKPTITTTNLSADHSYSHLLLPSINNITYQSNQPSSNIKAHLYQFQNLPIDTSNENPHSLITQITTITTPTSPTPTQHIKLKPNTPPTPIKSKKTPPTNHKADVIKQLHQRFRSTATSIPKMIPIPHSISELFYKQTNLTIMNILIRHSNPLIQKKQH